ncbi:MAG: dihydrolipoamide acetyltransferase family protein [Acidobacteriota bacterium]
MAFVFNFPDVGEGIHEGTVVEWLVAEGDTVAEDQPLVKVETDKAVVELPAPSGGTVLKINFAAGDLIHVGDALIVIGKAGESVADSGQAQTAPVEASESVTAPAVVDAAQPVGPGAVGHRRPLATPKTRGLARQLGVDLSSVAGSGSGGRITDDDVERASRGEVASAPTAAPPVSVEVPANVTVTADGLVERVSLTHLRKVIAGAMRSSKQISAHVTHVEEADATALMAAYRDLKPQIEAEHGIKFSVLPFFIKALVECLKDFPIFNASVDEEAGELVLKKYYNIGIAVDTPQGLIVPVIKDADQKDMVQLAREVSDLAGRARERRLGLDEMRGGSCTITNIGPLGGVFATPIINQPELAILGLHKIEQRPVVRDGEIVIRDMMYLSISFDHRWIDGAEGARFMTAFSRLVSNPNLLLARL